MEEMDLKRYLNILIKDWKIYAYFLGAMLIITVLYGAIFYKSTYKSTAKIQVVEQSTTSYVVNLNTAQGPNFINPKSNPILTQLEVLSSFDIFEKFAGEFKKNTKYSEYPDDIMAEVIASSIGFETPPGTDIILVTAKWEDPEGSQALANQFVDAYIDYNINVNRQNIARTKEYIKAQLKESNEKLKELKKNIEEFSKENASINIIRETDSVISQLTDIEQSISRIDSEINSEKSKSKALSEKLDLDVAKAINSVAIGQNPNILGLKEALSKAQQEHAMYKTKYTDENIKLIALNENIKELQHQLKKLIFETIGEELAEEDSSIIVDNVRMKMVDELVATQVNLEALKAQKESLELTYDDLKNKQSVIPSIKRQLELMVQEEEVATEVVKTLSAKLVEAKIKESEIISGVKIIETPRIPEGASFPTFFHILLIFEFLGALLATATILGMYFVKDICHGAKELEQILKAPVFGIIPWISDSSYTSKDEYNPASALGIAYKRILASLKIKSLKKNAKVIGFTTAEFEKSRSLITKHIAKNLVKSNKSVLIIDADFRTGALHKEFDLDGVFEFDLTNLLIEIEEKQKQNCDEKEIQQLIERAVLKLDSSKNLYLIPNNGNVEDPYELIMSEAFTYLINCLRNKVDFVLVDTPPMLAVPDTITISEHLEGIVVLCGLKTSRSNLRRINKICTDNEICILGAIARDSRSELEMPESKYISSLSTSQAYEQDDDLDVDDTTDDYEVKPNY